MAQPVLVLSLKSCSPAMASGCAAAVVPHPLGHRQGPWPYLNRHKQFAHGINGRPHPVAGTLQAFDGVLFTDLTILDAAQHGIQLVELQLIVIVNK